MCVLVGEMYRPARKGFSNQCQVLHLCAGTRGAKKALVMDSLSLSDKSIPDAVKWISSGGYVVDPSDIENGSSTGLFKSHAVLKALCIIPNINARTLIVYDGDTWKGVGASTCLDLKPSTYTYKGVKTFNKGPMYIAFRKSDGGARQVVDNIIRKYEEMVGDIARCRFGEDPALIVLGHSFGLELNEELVALFKQRVVFLAGADSIAWTSEEQQCDNACFDARHGVVALAYAYQQHSSGVNNSNGIPLWVYYLEQEELGHPFAPPGWRELCHYREDARPSTIAFTHFRSELDDNPERFVHNNAHALELLKKKHNQLLCMDSHRSHTPSGIRYAIVYSKPMEGICERAFAMGIVLIFFVTHTQVSRSALPDDEDSSVTQLSMHVNLVVRSTLDEKRRIDATSVVNATQDVLRECEPDPICFVVKGHRSRAEISWIDNGTASPINILSGAIDKI